jgi:hypothetical protein
VSTKHVLTNPLAAQLADGTATPTSPRAKTACAGLADAADHARLEGDTASTDALALDTLRSARLQWPCLRIGAPRHAHRESTAVRPPSRAL